MFRKLVSVTIIIVLLAILVPAHVSAQFQAYITFTTLDEGACTPGDYPVLSFNWGVPPDESLYYHLWTLTNDRTGDYSEWLVTDPDIGEYVEIGIIIETAVPAGTKAGDTLTLRADVYRVIIEVSEELVDSDSISWTCGGVAIAGCDILMPITETSVVGAFTANAMTYWKPGELTSPLATIAAGNTAWVLGKDSTGAYYKIIWVCDLLWVPVGTMGPNFDAVWEGKPLPTGVVD